MHWINCCLFRCENLNFLVEFLRIYIIIINALVCFTGICNILGTFSIINLVSFCKMQLSYLMTFRIICFRKCSVVNVDSSLIDDFCYVLVIADVSGCLEETVFCVSGKHQH